MLGKNDKGYEKEISLLPLSKKKIMKQKPKIWIPAYAWYRGKDIKSGVDIPRTCGQGNHSVPFTKRRRGSWSTLGQKTHGWDK